ncbi:MAG TPA: ABC transporter ATP-binding protein [Candidatus Angelobacter sp.]|jgi:multiple sugar transport system ATP-binding protein|nr:ABC transporter ATP-binding protein [Candidatus Angelobacter sp.]
MAVVETRDLTKIFKQGELGAVNNVNLVTREGEFLVFLGPSGSGKTTLLRMIAGLEQPTAGEILIGGQVVNHLSPRERRIAMVFQSYALYPHLTVYKNIAFPLKAQKVPSNLHKQKVEWAASLLGIGSLLQRKPRELSGGERQRVALARAIVREPSVFLLDEPLSNLDAKLRLAAREELERFHRRVGTTTIYVTHDQVEAMAMGDRIVVLNKGVVRQFGTPKEVYDDPADTFVATFLGSPPMNLLENEDVIVGFRPEHFRLAETVTDTDKVLFNYRIENVEYLGAEFILAGNLVGGKLEGKMVIARLLLGHSFEIGATYQFAVAQRQLKYFDRSTEKKVQARAVAW